MERAEIESLVAEGADAVAAVIARLEARIDEQDAQIAELKARLGQNSRNSSKPPSSDGLFYSYNQEAAMEFLGEPQGVVHKAVTKLGSFERVRRDRAWVRDGYVEEIYIPKTTASWRRS